MSKLQINCPACGKDLLSIKEGEYSLDITMNNNTKCHDKLTKSLSKVIGELKEEGVIT